MNIGDYVIRRRYSRWSYADFEVGQLKKVTAKQAIVRRYRDERVPLDEIVAAFPTEAAAKQIVQALAGVLGTYRQRRDAAEEEAQRRKEEAAKAADKAIARILASGMEAPSGGETGTGSTEGDSPTAESGDAQNDPADTSGATP